MPRGSGKTPTRRRKPKPSAEAAPSPTVADYFRAALGWKPAASQPFHTTANRECGSCRTIKPGSEFEVPVTPGRPDLDLCRGCSV
jgi:hypothetical protein